jgi:hypothetical protein
MELPNHVIPRDLSRELEGGELRIVPELSEGPARVAITDGERIAIYSPIEPVSSDRECGYVERLEADAIEIVPHYTEAGWDCVANVVALSDGNRKAIFVPVEAVQRPKLRLAEKRGENACGND